MSNDDWQGRQSAYTLGRDGSSAQSGWDNWTRGEYERGQREAEYWQNQGINKSTPSGSTSSSSSEGDGLGALAVALFLLGLHLYRPLLKPEEGNWFTRTGKWIVLIFMSVIGVPGIVYWTGCSIYGLFSAFDRMSNHVLLTNSALLALLGFILGMISIVKIWKASSSKTKNISRFSFFLLQGCYVFYWFFM